MTTVTVTHCERCGEWLESDFERKNGLCNYHLMVAKE